MTIDISKVVALESWRSLLSSGERAARVGDMQRALRMFVRATELAPTELEVWAALGAAYLQMKHVEPAEQALRKAFSIDPNHTAVLNDLGRTIGLQGGRHTEARTILEAGIARTDKPAVLLVTLGEILLDCDDVAGAKRAFISARDADPTYQPACFGLARACNCEGMKYASGDRAERAIFSFKRAAELDPNWSGPLVNLGVVFDRLGRPSKALESYRAALDRDPENPVALYNLGTALHDAGQLTASLETFDTLVASCPDFPEAPIQLANVLVDMQAYDRAIAILLEQIETSSTSVQAWSSLGLAYICSGNVDRGEECLRHALDIDPRHFNAYFNLAILYATQRRNEDAHAVLVRAFLIDPSRASKAFERESSFENLRKLDRFRFLQ